MTATTNRHPVDQLADVRADIAKLEEREKNLKALILDGRCDMRGDEFVAHVRRVESRRIDTTVLRKAWGEEKLEPFMKPSVVTSVRLTERGSPDDDEA